MAKDLGGKSYLILLGVLEQVIVLLFLIPRTGAVGALLMIAYIDGTIAVHFVIGQHAMFPITIEILIWVVSAIRFPELTQRLSGKYKKTNSNL